MLKRFVAGLLIALAFVTAPAWAAPLNRAQLSLGLAHDLIGAMPLNAMFDKSVEPMGKMFADVSRPEWAQLFKNAAHEELAAQMPQIEAVFAQRFFASYSIEELEAGTKLMNGPAGDAMRGAMAASALGQTAPQPSPAVMREVEKVMREPAGRGFFDKLAKIDSNGGGEQFGRDIVPMVVPGMFRRFGEKAEAYERAHHAAAVGR